VRTVANQEVRSFVSAHSWNRAAGLMADDLTESGKANLLLDLVDTDPTRYLPQLERLFRCIT
jgi:hypothetical protein